MASLTEFEKMLLQTLEEKDQLIASMQATITSLQGSVDTMSATIAELNQVIEALKEQLKKNSNNSSKPPSSDGYKKPSPKSLQEKTGKKQGGQEGHEGKYLQAVAKADEVFEHMPVACKSCPNYEKCKGQACVSEERTLIDAAVEVNIIAHKVLSVDCPLHGGTLKGEFPENVRGPIQYGENLQSLVVALNTIGALSINRIHTILGSVFNIPLSTGVIPTMVSRCADAVTGTVAKIRQKMAADGIGHFDETGTRVDGRTWWVHVACNDKFTYLYLNRKRGKEAMDTGGVLTMFEGIAVHDCWKPYWKYGNIRHAICNAHILRELNGVIENHPDQEWAPAFKKLLLDMLKAKDKALADEKEQLSNYLLNKFSKIYDEVLEKGLQENPLPEAPAKKRGRRKRGKVRALIDRLQEYKASVCLFIENFAVPFSNNQAEQDIRIVKVKTKVSGCFRTENGASDYLKIMSYVGTAKKHGMNPFVAIKQAITGDIQLVFS